MMKSFAEILKLFSVKQRIVCLFLLLLFPAISSVTTALLSHTDCSIVLKKYNELIASQSIKDDQCEADKQAMLQTQRQMQQLLAGIVDMKRMAANIQPDTVLVRPDALIALNDGASTERVRPMMIRKKVCPTEAVRPNKMKAMLVKKADELIKLVKK